MCQAEERKLRNVEGARSLGKRGSAQGASAYRTRLRNVVRLNSKSLAERYGDKSLLYAAAMSVKRRPKTGARPTNHARASGPTQEYSRLVITSGGGRIDTDTPLYRFGYCIHSDMELWLPLPAGHRIPFDPSCFHTQGNIRTHNYGPARSAPTRACNLLWFLRSN